MLSFTDQELAKKKLMQLATFLSSIHNTPSLIMEFPLSFYASVEKWVNKIKRQTYFSVLEDKKVQPPFRNFNSSKYIFPFFLKNEILREDFLSYDVFLFFLLLPQKFYFFLFLKQSEHNLYTLSCIFVLWP